MSSAKWRPFCLGLNELTKASADLSLVGAFGDKIFLEEIEFWNVVWKWPPFQFDLNVLIEIPSTSLMILPSLIQKDQQHVSIISSNFFFSLFKVKLDLFSTVWHIMKASVGFHYNGVKNNMTYDNAYSTAMTWGRT